MEGAVALHTIRQGAGPARPLVIAHGLFGSARNWGRIARDLSDRGPVIAADMRNHGVSPWTNHHDYAGMAADLAALIAAEDQPCDVLGHSMGGKAAMVLAIAQPELVARLVIADIAPIAYEHSQAHLVAAMRGVALDTVQTRRDADAALATAVPDPGTRAFLLHALDMQSHPPRWRLDRLKHRLAQPAGLSATTIPAAASPRSCLRRRPCRPRRWRPAWPMRRPGGAVRPAMKPAWASSGLSSPHRRGTARLLPRRSRRSRRS
jgi:pimeloyl-ACP methyl ester carboxylesterase